MNTTARRKTASIIATILVVGATAALAFAQGQQKRPEPSVPKQPISVPYTDIGHSVKIIGAYGLPLGTYLKLEGRRIGTATKPTKLGEGNFLAEKVNGKPLPAPTSLWLDRVTALPAGTACSVEGYETGEMIGVSNEVIQHTGVAPQAAFQFNVHFVTLTVRH